MKILYIAFLVFLFGCSPYLYDAFALKIEGEGVSSYEAEPVSKDCIIDKTLPKKYLIKRVDYSLDLEVSHQFVGYILNSENPNLSVHVNGSSKNDKYLTGISGRYQNYVPVRNNGNLLFSIMKNEKVISVENVFVKFITCKAMGIDAI